MYTQEQIKEFKADSNTATVEDMFYKDTDVDMDYRNCIYRIKNLVNGKSYIGQAKDLFKRFRYDEGFSHRTSYEDGNSRILYRSLWKYGLSNFEVSVLDYDVFPELLNYLEKYWVKELHACIYDSECWGYNMTWGGEDASHLHTPEVYEKQRRNHGGILAWNTPESLEKALATQRANNGGVLPFNTQEHYDRWKELNGGDYMAQCRTPEAIEKMAAKLRSPEVRKKIEETCIKRYGSVSGPSHTPEAVRKRMESDRANHGGVLGWNTPEAIENLIKRSKDPDLIAKRVITTYFNAISNNINKLKDNCKEINWENYYYIATWKHLYYVRDNISKLREDNRWTEEMEVIFSNMILDSDGIPRPN